MNTFKLLLDYCIKKNTHYTKKKKLSCSSLGSIKFLFFSESQYIANQIYFAYSPFTETKLFLQEQYWYKVENY